MKYKFKIGERVNHSTSKKYKNGAVISRSKSKTGNWYIVKWRPSYDCIMVMEHNEFYLGGKQNHPSTTIFK